MVGAQWVLNRDLKKPEAVYFALSDNILISQQMAIFLSMNGATVPSKTKATLRMNPEETCAVQISMRI